MLSMCATDKRIPSVDPELANSQLKGTDLPLIRGDSLTMIYVLDHDSRHGH